MMRQRTGSLSYSPLSGCLSREFLKKLLFLIAIL